MNESGLDFLTLAAAAEAIKFKELSPVDLTKFSLLTWRKLITMSQWKIRI